MFRLFCFERSSGKYGASGLPSASSLSRAASLSYPSSTSSNGKTCWTSAKRCGCRFVQHVQHVQLKNRYARLELAAAYASAFMRLFGKFLRILGNARACIAAKWRQARILGKNDHKRQRLLHTLSYADRKERITSAR